ncbi:unnamed protein product, partial [Polarella glacialis]
DLFWDRNLGNLKGHGISVLTVQRESRGSVLELEFRRGFQEWKCPASDLLLRQMLCGKGMLATEKSSCEEVGRAIKKFLQSNGQIVPSRRIYLQLVADANAFLSRQNPNSRT